MAIYLTLYSGLFALAFTSLLNRSCLKKSVLVFILVVLGLVAGTRDGTGTDYSSYLSLWNAAKPITEGLDYAYTHFEIGFRVIVSCLKLFTDSSVVYFTVISAIALIYFYKSLIKYNLNYYVATFIYLCIYYLAYVFNGMGQAIIISVFLYYFDDFLKLRTFKIFAVSIFFFFIHKSSIIILFSYVLFYAIRKMRVESLLFWGIGFSIIVLKTNLVLKLIGLVFPEMVAYYVLIFTENTSIFQVITRTMVLSLLFLFYKQLKGDSFYENSFKVYIIGYLLYIMLLDQNILATRINMSFRALEIIMFSYGVMHTKNLFTKVCIFLAINAVYGFSFLKIIQYEDFLYKTVLW